MGEEIESLFERAHARNKRFQPSLLSVEKPFRVYNETDKNNKEHNGSIRGSSTKKDIVINEWPEGNEMCGNDEGEGGRGRVEMYQ